MLSRLVSAIGVVNIVSISIGIIGIAASIITYFLSKNRRKISYSIKTNQIIDCQAGKIPELNIEYKKSRITAFSVDRIVFWNDGNQLLDKSHLTLVDPLRISITGNAKILECKVIQVTKKANCISTIINEDKSSVSIVFEYLDPEDGFVIDIYINSKTNGYRLKLDGAVKSVQNIKKKNIDTIRYIPFVGEYIDSKTMNSMPFVKKRRLYLIVTICYSAICIVGIILGILFSKNNSSKITVMLITVMILYWITCISFWKKSIPKKLLKYF